MFFLAGLHDGPCGIPMVGKTQHHLVLLGRFEILEALWHLLGSVCMPLARRGHKSRARCQRTAHAAAQGLLIVVGPCSSSSGLSGIEVP